MPLKKTEYWSQSNDMDSRRMVWKPRSTVHTSNWKLIYSQHVSGGD